ncbi:hypothetical protein THAOC_14615 [Thalassiosira oceanica]|uniref:Uncharacterized protein n=1 Tax=Thalassiosira oceanica TaxID=159749 RepID=K0T2I9_THAOC|nr:hypothetical protein THAOC_14615 [Thalassiosira oceanica]|eukprot:EJK64632.1 hypothetical protein THAOC_14615 [Thalassiosira oceanica]
MTDVEVVERVSDKTWEPAVFNLGQALRRMGRYGEAAACFARCCSLDPGSHAGYSALGLARHLDGDLDGAIDSYHEALSRKPEDPFTSEMLQRALAEVVTYPPAMEGLLGGVGGAVPGGVRAGGIGSSILGPAATGRVGDDVEMTF